MKTVVVHRFRMSDVEDPDLWAAQSLWEWEKSEKGSWVMENTHEPTWNRNIDYAMSGWVYTITTKMDDYQYTYYKLKYE
jgi:hypothetical protein